MAHLRADGSGSPTLTRCVQSHESLSSVCGVQMGGPGWNNRPSFAPDSSLDNTLPPALGWHLGGMIATVAGVRPPESEGSGGLPFHALTRLLAARIFDVFSMMCAGSSALRLCLAAMHLSFTLQNKCTQSGTFSFP